MRFILLRNAVGAPPWARRPGARAWRAWWARRTLPAAGSHEGALVDVLERLRNRFFGKYRGIVDRGRRRYDADQGQGPGGAGDQVSGWARACAPYAGDGFGFAFLPEAGAGVWIEFEGGDASLPDLVRLLLARRRGPADATADGHGPRHQGRPEVLFDVDQGSITIEDQNSNTITLDVRGITLEPRRPAASRSATSSVSVNDGALKVT